MPSNNDSAKDVQIRANLEIPDDEELQKMSLLSLDSLLSSCEKGSTKYLVVERERNRRIYADTSKMNLYAISIGAVITVVGGALFGALITNPSNPSHPCVCDCRKEGESKDSMSAPTPSVIEPFRSREQTKQKK